MKFKAEVTLLAAAITLFAVAMYCYTYQASTLNEAATFTAAAQTSAFVYPYRSVALVFVGFGSVSMVTAWISFSKKNKVFIK